MSESFMDEWYRYVEHLASTAMYKICDGKRYQATWTGLGPHPINRLPNESDPPDQWVWVEIRNGPPPPTLGELLGDA